MNRFSMIVVSLLILAAAGSTALWWRDRRPPPAVPSAAAAPSAAARTSAAPSEPESPRVRYPVPPAPSPPRGTRLSLEGANDQVVGALADLLGRKALRSFLLSDGIIRRFVATIDNLATDNASTQMWPVKTTPGRLETMGAGGRVVISAENAQRYVPFVRFAEAIDTERAVALYVRFYPLFQRAYEELGYPGRQFNDRVIEVIDNLLATPVSAGPLAVRRLAVDGAPRPDRDLYAFEDPALEERTAGQKILLRIGQGNATNLMAKLADLRRRLVTLAPGRATASE